MKFQNPSMCGSLDMTCIRFNSGFFFFFFFQKRITPEREISRTRKKKKKKKTWASYFSMWNPYMKFQNPRKHGT